MKHLFTNKRKIKRRFRKIRNVFPLSLGILETDHTACNPHCIKGFSVSAFVSHPLSHPLATKTIKYECLSSISRLASKPCCRLLLYLQNLPNIAVILPLLDCLLLVPCYRCTIQHQPLGYLRYGAFVHPHVVKSSKSSY